MSTLTVTARYRKDADTIFAEALSFDRLHIDLGGLVDYHGLPTGIVTEGQSYSFTPVLWTLFRLPETHVTCSRIDPVAREVESVSTQASGTVTPFTTCYLTRISPTDGGCLWYDRYEMSGPEPSRLIRALTRHIQKSGHKRGRARNITVSHTA